MEKNILKSMICGLILLITVSCDSYYHIGWSDFPKEEFLSFAPYKAGDTLHFACLEIEDTLLNEFKLIVKSSTYSYSRADTVLYMTDLASEEYASVATTFVTEGEGVTIYYYCAVSGDRTKLEFDIQRAGYCYSVGYDEAIVDLNDSYDITFNDSYVMSDIKIISSNSCCTCNYYNENIDVEIIKGIGISSITLDNVKYDLFLISSLF